MPELEISERVFKQRYEVIFARRFLLEFSFVERWWGAYRGSILSFLWCPQSAVVLEPTILACSSIFVSSDYPTVLIPYPIYFFDTLVISS